MKAILRDRRANAMIEYALLAAFVSCAAVAAAPLFGNWQSSGTGISMIFHRVALFGQCVLDGLGSGSCNALQGH